MHKSIIFGIDDLLIRGFEYEVVGVRTFVDTFIHRPTDKQTDKIGTQYLMCRVNVTIRSDSLIKGSHVN